MIRHTEEPTGEPIPTAASRGSVNARGPQCEWSCRWQDCRSPTYACCPPAHTPGNSSDASEATGNHWRMLYISVTHQCAVRLQLQLHHVHASTAVLVELLLESVNLKVKSGERMHTSDPSQSPTRTVMWRSCMRQRHAARSQLVHIYTQANTHSHAEKGEQRRICNRSQPITYKAEVRPGLLEVGVRDCEHHSVLCQSIVLVAILRSDVCPQCGHVDAHGDDSTRTPLQTQAPVGKTQPLPSAQRHQSAWC